MLIWIKICTEDIVDSALKSDKIKVAYINEPTKRYCCVKQIPKVNGPLIMHGSILLVFIYIVVNIIC